MVRNVSQPVSPIINNIWKLTFSKSKKIEEKNERIFISSHATKRSRFSSSIINEFYKSKIFEKYVYVHVYLCKQCVYIYIYNVNNVCTQTINKTRRKRDKTQTAVKNLYGLLSTIFTPFYINLDCL